MACARFYDVDRDHHPPALLQPMLHGLAHACPIIMLHTDVPSWINAMSSFVNRNTLDQEKSDREPHIPLVRYCVYLL